MSSRGFILWVCQINVKFCPSRVPQQMSFGLVNQNKQFYFKMKLNMKSGSTSFPVSVDEFKVLPFNDQAFQCSVFGHQQINILCECICECVCEWSLRSSGCRRRIVLKEDLVGWAAQLLLWAGELQWAWFQSCEWGCLPGGFGWMEQKKKTVRIPLSYNFNFHPATYMGKWFFWGSCGLFTFLVCPGELLWWALGGRNPMEMLVFTCWEDLIFCLDPFHPVLGEPNQSNCSSSQFAGVLLHCILMEKSWYRMLKLVHNS